MVTTHSFFYIDTTHCLYYAVTWAGIA